MSDCYPTQARNFKPKAGPTRLVIAMLCLSCAGFIVGPAAAQPATFADHERALRAQAPKMADSDVRTLASALAQLPTGTKLTIIEDPEKGTIAVPTSTEQASDGLARIDLGKLKGATTVTLAPSARTITLKPQQVTPPGDLDPKLRGREEFRGSACGAAVPHFKDFVEPYSDPYPSYSDLSALAVQLGPVLRDAILRFDEACYTKVTVPLTAAMDGRITVLAPALRAVAIITDINSFPLCTATHIGQGRFLTAHHCVTQPELPVSALRIHLLTQTDDKPRTVQVEQTHPDRDLVLLVVAGIPADLPSILPASGGSDPVEAAVVGHFLFQSPDAWIPSGIKPDWRNGIRVNRGADGGCLILSIARPDQQTGGARVVHTCQTTQGFSGGPLLVRERDAAGNSAWRLLAVHSGYRCGDIGPCPHDGEGVPTRVGNVAHRVPEGWFVSRVMAEPARVGPSALMDKDRVE